MKVLFVSAEMSPFAKVGGLADVVGSLPKALRELGHDARVVLPLYGMIESDPRLKLTPKLTGLPVQMNPRWTKLATYAEADYEGLPVGFIGTDEWFHHSKDSRTLYYPGGKQFLFFSEAVLRVMEEMDWLPDVIHVHDWHMGLLPALMREKHAAVWDETAIVYTIHNLAYQGDFDAEVLDDLALPRSLFTSEKLETWGRVNFLKSGCVYADRVNTVSKTYAREIQTPQYGAALEGLMRHLAADGRLSGILNGIDEQVFDPMTDPDLPSHFSLTELEGKATCRAKLFDELALAPIPRAPLMAVVSRMSSQKGMDLILKCAPLLAELPAQLVVLGVGEPPLEQAFRELQQEMPAHVRYVDNFNAPLGQRIYGGADAFLMPSRFEPCGLGQLIAMRYGTVPVVRATGGLADTVTDNENGYVFADASVHDFESALRRMHATYQKRSQWTRMMRSGMSANWGWATSAKEYSALYSLCVNDRLSLTA